MNVDINKEVQRAMMSPSQDQGIVNLLASELKAQDVKAKQQIKNLMAGQPDPNSIMAQNEKEVENNVRQEIGQKMQARVMQERQAQARQRKALAGIAGQRASNMRMADGGIVGYDRGGNVEGNNFSRHEFMYGPILKKLGIGPKYDFGGGLNEDFMNRAKRRAAEEKYGPDAAIPVGSGQPIPMLMQKYGSEKVMEYLNEQKRLRDIEGNVAPERREEFEMMKANIESLFDPQMIRDIRRAQTGPDEVEMAGGGIIGFEEGGLMPRFPRLFDFSMFLAERGIDSLAGLSADAVNRLRQEYEAMQAREMNRPRGDSVSESQMENLEGVLRGAGNVLREGIASPPSAGEREATEAQREGRRRGPGAMLEGIASLAPEGESDLQRELRDAERRMRREQGTDSLGIASSALDPRLARSSGDGLSLAKVREFARGLTGETEEQKAAQLRRKQLLDENFFRTDDLKTDGALFSGVPSLEELKTEVPEDAEPGYLQGARTLDILSAPFNVIGGFLYPDPEAEDFGSATLSDVGDVLGGFGRGLVGAEPRRTGETPTQQTDAEVAENIITTAPETTTATAPSTEDADAAAMEGVPQIANPSLRAAIEGAQEAPAATQEAVIDTASTVAQNPTPENTSRFESEIGRLMERRDSKTRALSDFLLAFSQARGGSVGQNLAIAATGMRAADDALDKQVVELEKLRSAEQISERDFQLKKDQVESDRLYRKAMADYYSNIESSRLELQKLVNEGKLTDARQRLRTELISAGMSNMGVYQMQARAADKNADASTINDRAMTLLQQDITKLINTFITNAGGTQNEGPSSSVVQDALAVIGQ